MNKTLKITAVFLIFFSTIFSGFNFQSLYLEAVAPVPTGDMIYETPMIDYVLADSSTISTAPTAMNVPGNTIHIKDENGTEIANALIQPDGSFSTTIDPLPAGTRLSVYQSDDAGNYSPNAICIVGIAETAPKVDPIPVGTTTIYGQPGSAYPGAYVYAMDPADLSNTVGTFANEDGSYEIVLTNSKVTKPGQQFLIYQGSPMGGAPSPAATVNVSSTTVPKPGVETVIDGDVIVGGAPGAAQPGNDVLLYNSNMVLVGTSNAKSDGSYEVMQTPQTTGTVVFVEGDQYFVQQKNSSGDVSLYTEFVVVGAIESPSVDAANEGDTIVTGSPGATTPGNIVKLYDSSGKVVGQTTSNADGSYSITSSTPVTQIGNFSVTQETSRGSSSAHTDLVVGPPLSAPLVDPVHTGDIVLLSPTNAATSGNTASLYDSEMNLLGTATVLQDGKFSLNKADGTTFNEDEIYYVTQSNAKGNISEPTKVIVGGKLAAPKVDPVYDQQIVAYGPQNSVLPNSKVTLYDADMNPIGEGTANSEGVYGVSKWDMTKFQNGDVHYLTQSTVNSFYESESEPAMFIVGGPQEAPKVNDVYEGDTVITGPAGSAMYGLNVSIELDGKQIGTAPVNPDGSYSVIVPEQVANDNLVVTQYDASGLKSPATETTVIQVFYNATFNMNGDTTNSISPQKLKEGEYITEPDQPIRSGYTFVEWNLNPDGTGVTWDFNQNKMPASDVVLYAIWEVNPLVVDPMQPGDTCITGLGNAGSTVEIKDENGNIIATAVVNPDGTFEICNIVPGGDVTIDQTDPDGNTSAATQLHTVTFDANGGNGVEPNTVYVEEGAAVSQPTNPTKPNYKFVSWNDSRNNAYDFATPVTKSMTLTASWEETTFTVDPMEPGTGCLTGTGEPGSTVEIKDENGNVVGTAVINPDGTFEICDLTPGGDNTIDQVDPDGNTSTPITLHTVTFDSNGGSTMSPNSVFVENGKSVATPQTPTKQGYKFISWNDASDKAYDFTKDVTSSFTLTASWETIPFTVDPMEPGTGCLTGTGESGSTVEIKDENGNVVGTAVINPDGTFEICDLTPGGDNTIDVVDPDGNTSTPITLHTVSFDSNGGSIMTPSSVFVEDGKPVSEPQKPAKANYTFNGWYDNSNYLWDFSVPVNDSLVLTAKWSLVPPVVNPVNPGDTCITGTGKPGATIEITDDKGNVIATGVVNEDGTFEICNVTGIENTDSINVSQNDGTSSSDTTQIKVGKTSKLPTTGENANELFVAGILTTLLSVVLYAIYYRRNI